MSEPVDERTAAMERAPPVDERTAAMERAPPVDERTAAMERAPPVDERTAAMERSAAPVDERTAAMERAPPVDERTAAMERAPPVDERTAAMERASAPPVDERTAAMERGPDREADEDAEREAERKRLGYEAVDDADIPHDDEAIAAATKIQAIHRGRQDRKLVDAAKAEQTPPSTADTTNDDSAPAAGMAPPQPPVDPRMAALEASMQRAEEQKQAEAEAEPDNRVVPVGEEGLSSPEPEEDDRIVPVGEEGIESPSSTPPPRDMRRSRREDTRIVPVGEEDIVGLDGTPTPPPFTPTPEPSSRPGSQLAMTQLASEMATETLGGSDDELSGDEEDYDDGPTFEEMYERYKEGMDERDKALAKNALLQHKIAELLAKRKQPDDRKELDAKAIADLEARYQRCLGSLEELHEEMDKQQAYYDRVASEMKVRVDEREDKATLLADTFNEYKRFVFQNAQNSRTGNPIPRKTITQYENKETVKDAAVSKERLKNISHRNQLKKLEGTLRAKEELAEGLHLIDFEQLKIENQTFNEKIEERNEELLKLRKKTTQTVQVLTHLKEKLQFVQTQNQDLKLELAELEEEVTSHRDALNKVKKQRDTYRAENVELQQHSGLVGTEELAKDFELGKVDLATMRQNFADLKARHRELSAKIKRIEKEKNQMMMAASQTEGVIMM